MSGRLSLLLGPMFSGKTSELLRRVEVFSSGGMRCALINFERNNRYGPSSQVMTHTGKSLPALSTLHLDTDQVNAHISGADAIAVDEGHFFGDSLAVVNRWAATRPVIVAALDGDYETRPFENVVALVAKAEEVIKYSAVCHNCRSPAAFSKRTVQSNDRLLVGGAEAYHACCRKCWESK
jgi:thymidine kinase